MPAPVYELAVLSMLGIEKQARSSTAIPHLEQHVPRKKPSQTKDTSIEIAFLLVLHGPPASSNLRIND